MQQYARDEDGDVWELDAAGNPVRMVTPAQQGGVFSLPQNPEKARQEQRADRREDRAEDTAARQAANDALGNQIKQIELQLKREELQKGDKSDKEARDRIGRLNALAGQIKRVRSLYDAGPGTTKGIAGLQDYLPTNENAQFDAAGASLSAQGLAAFRVPGSGTVSDRDAIMFDRANLPTASTRDLAVEEQLRGLQARVEEEYKALGQSAPSWEDVESAKPEQRADNEVPDPTAGADMKDTAPTQTVAQGGTRDEFDARMSAQVDSLINAGASKATIDEVLKKNNYGPLRATDLVAAQRWMKENPGKQYYGATITKPVAMNLLQRIAGSDVGAGLAHYANSATAGTVGALAGDKGKGALDAMKTVSPSSALAGQLLGGVTGAAGAEAALAARAGGRLAQYAPRIADTLFGATTGFNEAEEGEGVTGALTGGLAGLGGGILGDRLVRGVGATARGITNPNVRYLQGQGIEPTVGQVLAGSGRVGNAVKKTEDALTSVPWVGDIVNARRMEGLDQFNQAAFRQGAEPINANIGATGADGITALRDATGQAYDNALGPVNVNVNEPEFISDMTGLVNRINTIPNVNGARDAAAEGLAFRVDGAVDPVTDIMTGRGFQEAYRGLGRTSRERANGDYGHEVGQVMRGGQDALAGILERQAPGAFDGFRSANTAYRRSNILADAVGRAKSAEDELFTPSQLNISDSAAARRLNGPLASASGERDFYDLATAGQAILPSKLPDSGTATRAMVGVGVGGGLAGGAGLGFLQGGQDGAQTGGAIGLGTILALAAGGSRPAQRAAVNLLTSRSPGMIRVGDEILRNARIGGWAGAGTLPLLIGQ